MKIFAGVVGAVLLAVTAGSATAQGLAGFDGGVARAEAPADGLVLGNRVIVAKCTNDERGLRLQVADVVGRRIARLGSPFSVLFADGSTLQAGKMRLVQPLVAEDLKADAGASRGAERVGGKAIKAVLEDDASGLKVAWRVELRDGSEYVRESVTLTAVQGDLAMQRVRLVDAGVEQGLLDARVVGTVAGSPVAAGDFFLGFEHPLSVSRVVRGEAIAELVRTLPLPKGQSITYSAVVGVVPHGQLRRGFLTYVERERAHPYRTFLHYNSWYDLGYFTPYDEAGALDRVKAFGTELVEKRGVKLDSFLFDDGWDDHASLWSFNKGFPNGFAAVEGAAKGYGFAPGVWMSPWGGYSKPKQERLKFGKEAGFEIEEGGFALSGAKYYERFKQVCLEMMQKYGINQFKFDGTGNVNRVVAGSKFDSDFDAMIHLIGELREAKPDLYEFDYGDYGFAVLAAVCGLNLAGWGGR